MQVIVTVLYGTTAIVMPLSAAVVFFAFFL